MAGRVLFQNSAIIRENAVRQMIPRFGDAKKAEGFREP
jgi:hypothetical protein